MLRQFIIQNGGGYRLPYPAASWEEGIILGNGKAGAVVHGDGESEIVTMTHERLFAPVDEDITSIPMAEQLPGIRTLLDQKKYKEASELIVEMFREKEGLEEKIWTDPFIPAGNLNIFTEECGVYRNYERSLEFASGEGTVQFETDSNCHRRSYVMSRADECLAVLLRSKEKADYRISFSRTPYVKNGMHVNKKMFTSSGGEEFFCPAIQAGEGSIWYLCGYQGKEKGYGMVLCVLVSDGECRTEGQRLYLGKCKEALILASVFPVENVRDLSVWEREEERLRAVVCRERSSCPSEAYAALLGRHTAIHKERYDRIRLQLEDKHLETMFHAGRYEILSSSGELPPNLQGVWNGTYDTPWSSDYTQNGNLQTAILGLLPCGDFESLESLFGYEESLLPDYRTNSRVLYGCRGIHIPSRTSDRGIDFHFDITWPMVFWTAGAGWISHFYYDYWLYTCDDEFFRKRALPFMKEAALFYEDYLYEDESGCWKFSPSYSPENTPANSSNAAAVNSTMDISVATELFRSLITGCRTLGIEEENVQKWKHILDKMPPYLINGDGALKEWAVPDLEDEYDHRHSSHLYMLYYDIPRDEKPEILEAARKAYEIKMERKKKEQGTMAFGLVQAGMAAAHLGDSEMVDTMIQSMAQNNYYRTYASSHDYGPSIFNADISGGIPALMIESLVQCSVLTDERQRIKGYEIRLLPALPKSMETGMAEGIHLRGGFIVNLEWKGGKLVSYHIENPMENDYILIAK